MTFERNSSSKRWTASNGILKDRLALTAVSFERLLYIDQLATGRFRLAASVLENVTRKCVNYNHARLRWFIQIVTVAARRSEIFQEGQHHSKSTPT